MSDSCTPCFTPHHSQVAEGPTYMQCLTSITPHSSLTSCVHDLQEAEGPHHSTNALH
jgi:hypothetical protein